MRYALTNALSELLRTEIREKSVNALLLCPFHDERSPSFSVHLDDGMWHCFGCGKKGGINSLYKMLGEMMSDDIMQDIAIRSTKFEYSEPKDFSSLAMSQSLALRPDNQAIIKYVGSRPISPDCVKKFGLGWSQQRASISIPYWDDASVTGIKYRAINGDKRAEEGSSFGLYNVNDARGKGAVVICEGESDTHAMWSVTRRMKGLGVAGVSGAIHDKRTWERWSLDLIFASRVYLAMDADDTGDKGAEIAASVLGESKCVRIRPSAGKDICEHIMNGGFIAELGLEGNDLEVQRPADACS